MFGVGVALRTLYLNRPVYLDEAATFLDYARLPYLEIARTYFDPNNHVFYSVLMRGAYDLFGFSPVALRWVAWAAGILSLPLVYQLGRRLYNRAVGVVALGFAAVSVPLIEYSISGRGYSLMALCVLAALHLALWQIEQPRNIWAALLGWAGFAALCAVGFFTLPTMLYPLGGVALWLLLHIGTSQRGVRRWRLWAALCAALALGAALTLALYLPIIAHYGFNALANHRYILALTPAELLRGILRLPLVWVRFFGLGLPNAGLLALGGLVGVSLLADLRARRSVGGLMLCMGAWILAVILAQQSIPPSRMWVFLAPFVALWAARGLLALLTPLAPRVAVGVGGVLALLWAVALVRADLPNSYQISSGAHASADVAHTLMSVPYEDSTLLFVAGWVHPLWYYLALEGEPYAQRVLLTATPAQLAALDAPLLLAKQGDEYLPARLQEAYGNGISVQQLSPIATYSDDWVLYRVD